MSSRGSTTPGNPCLHTGRMTPEVIERLVSRRNQVNARVTELIGTRDWLDERITAARAHAAGA